MEIRKTFKFEMAHIVRKAYSQRCAKSIHGHSYKVELYFQNDLIEGKGLDEAGMLIDFGLVKKLFNEFMDLFDHALVLWRKAEPKEDIKFFNDRYERVIVTDFTSSAEVQAMMFRNTLNQIIMYSFEKLRKMGQLNSTTAHVSKVIVHETSTGKAISSQKDCTEKCMVEYVPKSSDFKHINKNGELARILDEVHR